MKKRKIDPEYGVELPEGITLQDLEQNYGIMEAEYRAAYARMKVLDLADTGRIWDLIAKEFPEYQISPDTNYVNYIKENILASVYTVGKNAQLLARKKEDVEMVAKLNKVLETVWGVLDVPFYQLQAGERAALLNLGITQVGWSADLVGGTHESWYKGDLVFKNIDPINFGRDPFADTLEESAWCIYHNMYHRFTLLENENYIEALKQFNPQTAGVNTINYDRSTGRNINTDSKYYHVIIHWVKLYDEKDNEVKIHEIHTIDNQYVLHVNEDIKPRMFPFAELYSTLAVKDPVGVSEPSKILASTIVYNLLDGIMVTHAYKAQRPPRFISDRSGLNLRAFQQYGNDPDKVFIVHGLVDDVVKYMQFPPLPQGLENVAMRISMGIERMSGIDQKYTGKDTGSILTTGGIDSMLAQATMRDTTRIRLYENYTRQLTRLIIQFMIEYGDKRQYTYKPKNSLAYETVEIDFAAIPPDILFNYSVDISTDVPKNKAKLDASADAMLEKSMQYQANPEIITTEEWLMFKDFPQKDLILERIKLQREANMTEQIAQILSMFAALTEQGMDPNQAIDMIAKQMEAQQQPGGQAQPPGPPMM